LLLNYNFLKNRLLNNGIFIFSIFIFIFSVIPFLNLIRYSYPGWDDFWFYFYSHKLSFWESQSYFYLNVNGRYSATFLLTRFALLYKNIFFFRVIILFIILSFIGSLFFFFRTYFKRDLSNLEIFILLSFFVYLYLIVMPSPAEGFYWLAASVTYTFSILIFLLLLCQNARRRIKKQFFLH